MKGDWALVTVSLAEMGRLNHFEGGITGGQKEPYTNLSKVYFSLSLCVCIELVSDFFWLTSEDFKVDFSRDLFQIFYFNLHLFDEPS